MFVTSLLKSLYPISKYSIKTLTGIQQLFNKSITFMDGGRGMDTPEVCYHIVI